MSETYKAQLDDYESRKKCMKQKRRNISIIEPKKEARKMRVDSIPEKLSKREEWEKSKKVSN